MAEQLLKNNAYSTVATWGIGTGTGTFTVAAAEGARFPTISGGNWFFVTLQDAANNIEIIKITARSTDTLTAGARAQEGTVARTWVAGDIVELRITAGTAITTDNTATMTNKTLSAPVLVTPVLGTPASGTLSSCTALPIDAGTTGTLPVSRGGTGVTTIAANGLVVGAGTSPVTTVAPGTNGQVLMSNGTVWAAGTVVGFSTGDVKLTIKTVADSGWVMFDDGTIGNASSGATTRANADTVDLFTLLWNNTADAQCAVSSGRGASAAADYAANKTIALPKALGRALATYGTGSGLTARVMAETLGVETHPLAINEITSHTHSFSATTSGESGHTHGAGSFAVPTSNSGVGVVVVQETGAPGTTTNSQAITGTSGGSSGHTHTISGTSGSAGSSAAHQNMQPTLFLNTMIKL